MTVVAWFAATRRDVPAMAVASPSPIDDGPDVYSTELDMTTLEGMRRVRPFSAAATQRKGDGRRFLAAGAGIAAAAGAFLLLRRK
ncbi:MAG TPA: hypothetical protein PKD27_01625 [Tepidiformaceae bacterium]|nr:hypothetical protein [Tepidiformaceae bacterium]